VLAPFGKIEEVVRIHVGNLAPSFVSPGRCIGKRSIAGEKCFDLLPGGGRKVRSRLLAATISWPLLPPGVSARSGEQAHNSGEMSVLTYLNRSLAIDVAPWLKSSKSLELVFYECTPLRDLVDIGAGLT
jgi:hypothetical protein